MSFEIAAFLIVFVVGLFLFSIERTPPDVTALGLMLTLILLGLIEPVDAFAGFGSETVMMILGLLILTQSLTQNGLVDTLGRWLLNIVNHRPYRLKLIWLTVPAAMSAFISNTASTAFFLPIALGLANRTQRSASKLLMPLAFTTILAGSVTLVGSSTNLVASGLMQQHNLEPLGMFELTPVGLPILLVGLLYMATIGNRLIPNRSGTPQQPKMLDDDLYFTEITIPPHSGLIGKTIDNTMLMNELQLGMLELQRGDEQLKPLAEVTLQTNDTLIVEATREAILRLPDVSEVEISGSISELELYMKDGTARIAEVVILPGSSLAGRTIKGLGLRDRYQMQILAVNQGGAVRHNKIGRLILHIGDVLLVKMPDANLQLLAAERMFRILDIVETVATQRPFMFRSSAIFAGSMALAITGILPIAVAVLVGVFLIFLSGCMTPEEAYRRVEWKMVILIGSMLAFGRAMQQTGTADYLADIIIKVPGVTESPLLLLALFFILAMMLTQPMSNQAAAASLVPIAIQTALLLDYNPRPFAIMIALAASASFITPLEPACVLVYSAGRYRFIDFIRVGGLLTIIVFLVAYFLVPQFWQLTPA